MMSFVNGFQFGCSSEREFNIKFTQTSREYYAGVAGPPETVVVADLVMDVAMAAQLCEMIQNSLNPETTAEN